MTACMKTRIAQAITNICATVPGIETVTFDRVKLLSSDFIESELPAIQLIDVTMTSEHEKVRAKKTWSISLELVMRPNELNEVRQPDLWDMEQAILRKLWQVPNLGIPGVIQMQFNGSATDLHLLEPYYFARLDFDIIFYEALVDEC